MMVANLLAIENVDFFVMAWYSGTWYSGIMEKGKKRSLAVLKGGRRTGAHRPGCPRRRELDAILELKRAAKRTGATLPL